MLCVALFIDWWSIPHSFYCCYYNSIIRSNVGNIYWNRIQCYWILCCLDRFHHYRYSLPLWLSLFFSLLLFFLYFPTYSYPPPFSSILFHPIPFNIALLAITSGLLLSKDLDSLNLMYYMAPISFLLLYPVAHFTEGPAVIEWYFSARTGDMVILLISGIISYLLSILLSP